jgi:hypothetical protein
VLERIRELDVERKSGSPREQRALAVGQLTTNATDSPLEQSLEVEHREKRPLLALLFRKGWWEWKGRLTATTRGQDDWVVVWFSDHALTRSLLVVRGKLRRVDAPLGMVNNPQLPHR